VPAVVARFARRLASRSQKPIAMPTTATPTSTTAGRERACASAADPHSPAWRRASRHARAPASQPLSIISVAASLP